MQIPINVRAAPFRHKYLDEETHLLSRWFIFGGHIDGTVGISDADNQIFIYVPRDVAERIVAARDAFCDTILAELGT